jgi:hypothetical protein
MDKITLRRVWTMRLLKALLEDYKRYNIRAVKYKGIIYYHDPYGFELRKEAGKFTEFRCNIGTFKESLLSSHMDFFPEVKRNKKVRYPDIIQDCKDEFKRQCMQQLYNMYHSNGFRPISKKDAKLIIKNMKNYDNN